MKQKKYFLTLLCFIAIVATAVCFTRAANTEASAQKLEWHRYDEAVSLAKKTQKYVLVEFMAEWCGYCKLMRKTTYSDPRVQDILRKKFVLAQVDIESDRTIKFKGEKMSEADVSMYYEVTGTPTTWFFDSRGNAIVPLPGYVEPDKFHAILKYIAGGFYKKMKFNEFMQKKALR